MIGRVAWHVPIATMLLLLAIGSPRHNRPQIRPLSCRIDERLQEGWDVLMTTQGHLPGYERFEHGVLHGHGNHLASQGDDALSLQPPTLRHF